ncbi:MAG TPA: CHAP domain-containing protein, partial [Anaerolineaceae bacterium]
MRRLLRICLVFSLFLALPMHASGQADSTCPRAGAAPLTLSVDGVSLQGCLPLTPASAWVLPRPNQPYQSAYTGGSGAGFTVTAVPFGSAAASEGLPRIDASSREDDLRGILRQARLKQGALAQAGPAAKIFGREVTGTAFTLSIPVSGTKAQETRITEWLLIHGQRLWIFRAVQPAGLLGGSPAEGLEVSSPDANAPSTSAAALQAQASQAAATPTSTPAPLAAQATSWDLPSPSWWHGTCDSGRYPGAYPLGPSFRNVIACGPLPGLGYWDLTTYFYSGAFPVYEWECVELVLRYMYLAYGVPPYAANGSGIVFNYTGSAFVKVNNGTRGTAPVPGDVLSYGATSTWGHTSVVIASTVNSYGNGSITVMEQNWTYSGRTVLNVVNWVVYGDAGWIYAWLHP